MMTARWLIPLLGTLAAAWGAQGQGTGMWSPGDAGLPGGRHVNIVYVASCPYLGSYGGMSYCGYPLTRVSFFQTSSPLLVGPSSWLSVSTPRQGLLLDPELEALVAVRRPRTELPTLPAPFDPGAPASVFRPILPEDRFRALQPEQPDMPPPVIRKPKPQVAPKPKAPPPEPKPLLGPGPPEANPGTENIRQIRLGREAFAAREYGRAERRFQDAALVMPQEHLAYFLLAQAKFALGKYQEAVASIQAGMRIQDNWPSALFWPRDLYEGNVADYTDQLDNLAAALAQYPNDPVLLFLTG